MSSFYTIIFIHFRVVNKHAGFTLPKVVGERIAVSGTDGIVLYTYLFYV